MPKIPHLHQIQLNQEGRLAEKYKWFRKNITLTQCFMLNYNKL